jgi:O-antigen ligase
MAFAVFLAVIFFAPLAFGTTEVWSTITAQLLASVAVLLCFFPKTGRKAQFYRVPGLLPLLLFLGWNYVQLLPLPVAAVQVISPQTVDIYQPVLDFLPPDTWIPLTINQQATLFEALRFTIYILFYLLTIQLLTSNKRLSATVASVVWLTLFIAFVSMLQRAAAPDSLFFVRKMEHVHGSFGPWVYKNQYAGFMVMTCPFVLALFLRHRPIIDPDEPFRERFLHLFSGTGASLHLFFGFGVIVVIASVLLAQSRGGFLSLAFALLLFFLILARSQGKIQTWTLLFLLLGLLAAGGWFSWDAIVAKFDRAIDLGEGTLQDPRFSIWKDAIKIIPDFPITGTGFGTFLDIFPNYKSFADSLIYDHAHNDYLELLTDGGLIGFLLAAWFVIAVLRNGWRMIFRRHERLAVLTAVAAFSGIAGLLFFSLTDFNLHNWANSLYFFFLCGLLVSAGHTRRHYRKRPTLLSKSASPKAVRIVIFAAAALFVLVMLRLQGGVFLADRYYRQAHTVSEATTLDFEQRLPIMNKLLEEAARKAPFNGNYRYALGNIRRYEQKNKQALQLYMEAVRVQPMEGTFLQALGLEKTKTDLAKGRKLVQLGYARAKLKEGPFNRWVDFELSHRNLTEAFKILRQELRHDPRLLKIVFPLLTARNFSKEETASILPDLTSAWIDAAKLSRAAGKEENSSYFLKHALAFIDQEPQPKSHYFMSVFQYYQKLKELDKAAAVLWKGIRYLPDYAPFYIYLGDYYRDNGMYYRAVEEYKQALLIQPDNDGIKNRLKQVEAKQQAQDQS